MVDAIIAGLSACDLVLCSVHSAHLVVAEIPRGLLHVELIGWGESILGSSWPLAVLPGSTTSINQVLSLIVAHANHGARGTGLKSLAHHFLSLNSRLSLSLRGIVT
jgi:hypothetical protein